jgi:hypothetical protein
LLQKLRMEEMRRHKRAASSAHASLYNQRKQVFLSTDYVFRIRFAERES